MARIYSIRRRLIVGAFLVLGVFLLGAGLALERAYASSVLEARFSKLQSDVYLMMAAAEVADSGSLTMPAQLEEPRFSLPASGLYANVYNVGSREEWQSLSTLGLDVPFLRAVPPGEWAFERLAHGHQSFLAVAYAVRWAVSGRTHTLVFAVSEDDGEYRRALTRFRTTLWSWLGGAAVMLLVAQGVLLSWVLRPLSSLGHEIRQVEDGTQSRVAGHYPVELEGVTRNLNALIERERAQQARFRDALGDLAHSLKTPLAMLRTALDEPASLPDTVRAQVTRMDHIVQHQLGRAAASGQSRLAKPIALRPVVDRIVDSLGKIYRDRCIVFSIDCDPALIWRMDEGDAFEAFGNTLDNAAKWAAKAVHISLAVRNRALEVVVADDGPGFADPEVALQRGVRVDERVPGHGIGLTVVADILTAYGGSIQLGRGAAGSRWPGAQVTMIWPKTV